MKWSLDLLTSDLQRDLGSAIWDSDIKTKGNLIAAALDDGSIKLLSVYEDFHEKYSIPKKSAKCLCAKFSSAKHNKSIYAGYSDGIINKFNYRNKSTIISISYSNPELSIWRIVEIDENEIGCADSSGTFRVWNAAHGISLYQNKQSQYDLLCLCTSNGTVYATGVDSKICSYQRQANNDWVASSSTRGQSHDVRSILCLEDALISGGINTDICIYPLKNGRFEEQGKSNIFI
jgi:hypothetical protein